MELNHQHGPDAPKIDKRYAMLAGVASLAVAGTLIIAKTAGFFISGSVSVLASLIDSVMDAVVSAINFMAIRYSLKPADHEHRFGHGKIEGLAALFQASFIGGAGVFLVFESLQRLAAPQPAHPDGLVIGIMLLSVVLSALLIVLQNFTLRFAPSLTVEAEKAHYSGDIAINAGVLAVLLGLKYGAPAWVDPAFAALVACHLGWTARKIAAKGLDMVLDRELPDDMRAAITRIVNGNPRVLGMHDLRTRKAGMDVHISFDIELDPEQSLKSAHEVVIALEQELLKLFPNAEILIHKDPAGIHHVDKRHHVAGVHTA